MCAIKDIRTILASHSHIITDFRIKKDGNQYFVEMDATHPYDQDARERLESILLQIQWHIIYGLQDYIDISFICKVTLLKSDISWQKEFYMDKQKILHVNSCVHPFFLLFDDIIKQLT